MAHRGMKFGIFLAPFHRVGENPTLAISRDVELLERLDGWATTKPGSVNITAPAGRSSRRPMIITAAAERTKHIKLGTGVTSLPYHHPLMVANRMTYSIT